MANNISHGKHVTLHDKTITPWEDWNGYVLCLIFWNPNLCLEACGQQAIHDLTQLAIGSSNSCFFLCQGSADVFLLKAPCLITDKRTPFTSIHQITGLSSPLSTRSCKKEWKNKRNSKFCCRNGALNIVSCNACNRTVLAHSFASHLTMCPGQVEFFLNMAPLSFNFYIFPASPQVWSFVAWQC